jgi:FkbM family methyltransferase
MCASRLLNWPRGALLLYMHLYDILQDRFVREVFVGDTYPQSKGVVLDVGALNGEYSLYTYSVADKIICVEPNPKPAQELSAKVEEYGLAKIHVYEYALSCNNDGAFINRTDAEGGNVTTDNPDDLPVKSITLNKIMELEGIDHIDMLKIDIEGHEQAIFSDPDFPWSKVDAICGEHVTLDQLKDHGFIKSDFGGLYTRMI